MRIAITGATGFVGSNLCKYLMKIGHTIYEIHGLSHGGNLFSTLAKNPDLVIHCAAKMGGIGAIIENPKQFLDDNYSYTRELINECVLYDIKNFINLSSASIYSSTAPNPIKEGFEHIIQPTESTYSYSIAKFLGIMLCNYTRKETGYNYFSIVPTNLYGPGDHYEPERSNVVASLIRKFATEKKVVVWGTGQQCRDVLFVEDLCSAILHVINNLEYCCKTWEDGMINIGSGFSFTIGDICNKLFMMSNGPVVEYDWSKPMGPMDRKLDISRIQSLGWTPQWDIDSGLKATYNSFIESQNVH